MKDYFEEMNAQPGVEVNIMPVVGDSSLLKLDESQLPDAIPVLALRNAVVFPGTVFPVTIGREKSIRLIRDAESREGVLGAVPQTDVTVEDPAEGDLAAFGTVCKVVKTLEMPDGSLTAILQGFKRVHVDAVIATEPYLVARVTYEEDYLPAQDEQEMKVLSDALKERAGEIIRSSAFAPKEAVGALKAIDNFQFLVNFGATTIEVENFEDRVDLLRYADVHERGMALLKVLDTQVQLLHIKQEINQKVKSDIDQQQREYYLNNQLRTIQEELGMDERARISPSSASVRTPRNGPRKSGPSSTRRWRGWRNTTRPRRTTVSSTTTSSSCWTFPGERCRRTTWTSGMPSRCWTRTTSGWTR